MDMPKTYAPKEFEKRIYDEWLQKGYFKAEVNKDKVPFTVIMPPPNVTGQLHMGHALNLTMQDITIRFKRMQGYEALWLPGIDHASIATEVKIVDMLKKEGTTKEALGREKFLERAYEWKEKYGGRIMEQVKALGSSCDFDRLTFTMDKNVSNAVNEVFVHLYDKGLLYHGSRIINWCPCCKTALSDAEVEFSEEASHLWHLKYPVKDSDEFIIVATTRPETMLGDTAVAVNPDDKRYKKLVGKTLVLPLMNREIPIVADSYVEKDFGSGAVKITPAHDPNDFEVGLRHQLPVIRVMNDDGTMNESAGAYVGLSREDARKKVVADMDALGLLVKVEDYAHNVGHCYRCHSAIEPIISKQWFVKMDTLAKPAIDVVKKKSIKIMPKRFQKIYFNWMENIKDWCISRQLWWGHRIPVYYCEDCGEEMVSKEAVKICKKCGSAHIHQDEDVLDTWFSSALWPFSTLGYPEKTEDLKYFYPTDVLITAYDIIFFWVARMIFSGLEYMDRVPFKEVLFHGLVRDAEGRKMSKSLGNGIDPIEIIDNYGADTLRFTLINGISLGGDTRFSVERAESGRNFMNKIWNASRFVLMNIEGKQLLNIEKCTLTIADKWIISRLNDAIRKVNVNLEKYEQGLALAALYDFLWDDFCDWYIELCKPVLYGNDEKARLSALSVLTYVLGESLKLLHPFVPFITEEIYSNLPIASKSIMLEKFPSYNVKNAYKKDAQNMEIVKDIIRTIRNVKQTSGAPVSKKITLYVLTELTNLIKKNSAYIKKLAGVEDIIFITDKSEISEKTIASVTDSVELFIPLGELVDTEKEIARLGVELEKAEQEIARAAGKLANNGFLDKAPKALVDAEREKREKFVDIRLKIVARIKELKE